MCTDLKYQLDHRHMQCSPGYKACIKHEMKMSWLYQVVIHQFKVVSVETERNQHLIRLAIHWSSIRAMFQMVIFLPVGCLI